MRKRFSFFWSIALIFTLFGCMLSSLPAEASCPAQNKSCCFCYACDAETGCTDPYMLKGEDGNPVFNEADCDVFLQICNLKQDAACAPPATPDTPATAGEDFVIKDIFLGVTIPGLKFSTPTSALIGGSIYISWLAEYLKAVYNYSIVVISIIGVVAIIIQGIRVITSAGGPAKSDAYKKITQIVIGLFIGWGSYVLLYMINPGLTAFEPLEVKFISQDFVYEGAELEDGPPTSGTANPALKKTAETVAAKLGINSCLFAAQVGFESSWIPTRVTGCCAGLGQVMKENAISMLADPGKRAKIIETHSEGCPKCPQPACNPKKPTKEELKEVEKWLTEDPEGNLIAAAMIRKSALDSAPNPLAAAAKYGMGNSYEVYLKTIGSTCKPSKYNAEQLFAKIKSGMTADQLVKDACIPPPTFALQNPGKGSVCGKVTGDSYLCCEPGTEGSVKGCVYAKPFYNEAGLNMGRKGKCGPGTYAGKDCWGIAGSELYIKRYVEAIKSCAK